MNTIAPAPGTLDIGFEGACRSNARGIFDGLAVVYARSRKACLGNDSTAGGIRGGMMKGLILLQLHA